MPIPLINHQRILQMPHRLFITLQLHIRPRNMQQPHHQPILMMPISINQHLSQGEGLHLKREEGLLDLLLLVRVEQGVGEFLVGGVELGEGLREVQKGR